MLPHPPRIGPSGSLPCPMRKSEVTTLDAYEEQSFPFWIVLEKRDLRLAWIVAIFVLFLCS
jgi:hypothetical protein